MFIEFASPQKSTYGTLTAQTGDRILKRVENSGLSRTPTGGNLCIREAGSIFDMKGTGQSPMSISLTPPNIGDCNRWLMLAQNRSSFLQVMHIKPTCLCIWRNGNSCLIIPVADGLITNMPSQAKKTKHWKSLSKDYYFTRDDLEKVGIIMIFYGTLYRMITGFHCHKRWFTEKIIGNSYKGILVTATKFQSSPKFTSSTS